MKPGSLRKGKDALGRKQSEQVPKLSPAQQESKMFPPVKKNSMSPTKATPFKNKNKELNYPEISQQQSSHFIERDEKPDDDRLEEIGNKNTLYTKETSSQS